MATILILISALASSQGGMPAANTPGPLARYREMLADNSNPRGQAQAALLLLQDLSPNAGDTVRQFLNDRTQVGAFAALGSAIAELADGRFQEELLNSLGSENEEILSGAVMALGASLEDKNIDRLGTFLLKPDGAEKVRRAAARVLSRTGKKSALAFLVLILQQPRDPIIPLCRQLLSDWAGQDLGPDPVAWNRWLEQRKNQTREKWLEEKIGVYEAKLGRLGGELENTRVRNRVLYSQLFSRLNSQEKMPFLRSLAAQEDPQVRIMAVHWYAESLSEESSRMESGAGLLSLSKDSNLEVQRQAILHLGKWQDAEGLKQLLAFLNHDHSAIRSAAVRSLAPFARGAEKGKNLPLVLEALNRALKDPAQEVVVEVAEELGSLGVDVAGPVLVSLLGKNPDAVRKSASSALERVAGIGLLDDLLLHLNDPLPSVRLALLGAIARATTQRQVKEVDALRLQARLESLLLLDKDAGVRSRAADLLESLGGTNNLPGIWKAVKTESDSRAREKAWSTLVVILARNGDVSLVFQWEKLIAREMPDRLVTFLSGIEAQWGIKTPAGQTSRNLLRRTLVIHALASKQWRAAWLSLRSLPVTGPKEESRLRLEQLLQAMEMALVENAGSEVLSMVEMARLYLPAFPEYQGKLEDVACQAAAIQPR